MPTNLKPFRDYDEHDVINLFGHHAKTADKGTFVKILTGWTAKDELQHEPVSSNTYGNTVSQRYSVKARVTPIVNTGDKPLGMLLYEVRETDENSESLLFNPRKAAEMQICLSGQAVPIATKGIFLYSGVSGHADHITPGNSVYIAGDGGLTPTGDSSALVGKFLGKKDADGFVLIKLDL